MTFTIITDVRGESYCTQHEAQSPEDALRLHIGRFPHYDEVTYEDGEIDFLVGVADGSVGCALLELDTCTNTWLWKDGLERDPQYSTHVIKTDVS